ncbi:RHS repeat domain-containing protein, partial [Pseudomonas indica]|uniref:RHS repeat domain-containing protein n=1 Tax=Pseudomonas indica TaxID=137658 RepID=UPI0023F6C960
GGHALAETLTFTTYYHNDHLGNPVAATDERGDLLWRAHFTPYGERHENPATNAFGTVGYTGHAQDKASGLVYMGARYYDPVIGRFMAVDPVGFQDQNPQSFGRYLYANNNPHKYMDPDGRSPLLLFWAGAAAFGGAMVHSDYANAPAQGEEP